MIEIVIEKCKKLKKKISVCGQAPSDFPDFAKFLVDKGVSCMSLIPDTITPLREFLYSEDLADAIEFLLDKELDVDLINIGSNHEVSIKDLAFMIKELIGFKGEIIFDKTKPDGNPRKLLDSSLINSLGWESTTSLENGLSKTYDWFKNNR